MPSGSTADVSSKSTENSFKYTRKLCYRKDDRAMRPDIKGTGSRSNLM